MVFTQENHIVQALVPDADRFNGDPSTDIISLKNYDHITFVLDIGVGATGTATITANYSDDAAGSTTAAMAFRYRKQSASNDSLGDVTDATTSGVTTTAGGGEIYVVEIDADELPAGSPFVFLTFTEVVDSPVDAGCIAILSKPTYPKNTMVSPLS